MTRKLANIAPFKCFFSFLTHVNLNRSRGHVIEKFHELAAWESSGDWSAQVLSWKQGLPASSSPCSVVLGKAHLPSSKYHYITNSSRRSVFCTTRGLRVVNVRVCSSWAPEPSKHLCSRSMAPSQKNRHLVGQNRDALVNWPPEKEPTGRGPHDGPGLRTTHPRSHPLLGTSKSYMTTICDIASSS